MMNETTTEPDIGTGTQVDLPELSLADMKPVELRILGYLVGGATTEEARLAAGLSEHAFENHVRRLNRLLPPSRRHRGALVAYGYVMGVDIIPIVR